MGLLALLNLILFILTQIKFCTSYNYKALGTDWSITETMPKRDVRKGELIFSDEFNTLDLDTWEHEITMAGGGNSEFQLYHNNRSNSYVKYGKLYIKPTLTADKYGGDFLTKGHLHLTGGSPADQCTNPSDNGCERRGSQTNIINPIMSARIRTLKSFAFKYGRVEARAKLPSGDWIWPAIWLMPLKNQYGGWPASGEIDIMESRGNKILTNNLGQEIGASHVGSTLHFGPFWPHNGFQEAHFTHKLTENNNLETDDGFHIFELEWTPEYIKFIVDKTTIGTITPRTEAGFWNVGNFPSNIENPWKYGQNPTMAPFDQKFYIIINLAVGGTNHYFPDNVREAKPWKNDSPRTLLDFWNARNQWFPTWNEEDSALQVDYIRVYAL